MLQNQWEEAGYFQPSSPEKYNIRYVHNLVTDYTR